MMDMGKIGKMKAMMAQAEKMMEDMQGMMDEMMGSQDEGNAEETGAPVAKDTKGGKQMNTEKASYMM